MKIKIVIAVIAIIMLLIIIYPTGLSQLPPFTDSNVVFDLFTQKEPYNGKGPNQPSDMFGPQENVTLYALLTVNGFPLSGKPITFRIRGPVEEVDDVTFYQTAETNQSGIAETCFSLSIMNQTSAFGTWVITGTAEVDGQIYEDTLTFRVGWIIELLSVRTIDENLNSRMYFGEGGDLGLELSLRNNAMVTKTTFIAITVFDELNVPVSFLQIEDLVVPPKGKIIYIYPKLTIPKFAVPGVAKVSVIALDNRSVSYCPEISTNFWITVYDPIFLNFVDASIVYSAASSTIIAPGENIEITAVVRNEGTNTLSNFNIYVYANDSFVGSNFISKLEPFKCELIKMNWNTSGLPEGNYIVTVSVPVFAREADLSDNSYSFFVELKIPVQTYIHDVQILKVKCSTDKVYQGENLTITITVRNSGNSTESTVVRLYYDHFLIGEIPVAKLIPSEERELSFEWNTTSVSPGEYKITVVAVPVEGETNTADNIYYGGIIKIMVKSPQIIHDVAVTALYAQPLEAVIGEPIQITVQVKNLGTEPESSNVTLFYDNFPMATLTLGFLAPGASSSLTYVWNTSSVMEGNYTIKAYITPVEGEQNTSNNWFSDGTVWIKAPSIPVKKHDVAVTALNISKRSVYRGETLNIAVYVANFGDFTETFSVSVYANMTIIWSYTVEGLQANSSRVLSFSWDTSKMNIGGYTIWAKAEYVAEETNIENNIYVNGTVAIQSPPAYYIHDVAVTSIQPASYSVLVGQKLNVLVTVKNYGNATESFNVTLYYDSKTIQELPVYLLQPMTEKTINFEWDTSNVENGTYILRAYAEPVSGETNIANNILVDGAVSVLTPPPTITRDVEIVWLMAEPSEVIVGDNVTIKVTVLNLGSLPESFNVTVYCNSKIIGTLPVVSLTPYVAREITLTWNTSGETPGVYTLSADATILEGEVDTQNNHFTDGSITIKPVFAPSYLTLLAPFIIGLAAFLAIILLYYVRKKRKAVKPTPQFIIVSRPHI